MSRVISLEEAARRTGLTRRQIGDLIADPNSKVAIERDPVTGEKGVYPHTLRGVNGYQPPKSAPPPRPPPPPEPEPWTPDAAELAALIKLDDRGRAVAIAELARQHPQARAWFRDNPLPPVFRKQEPPPPPQAKPPPSRPRETPWELNDPPRRQPEPAYRKPSNPPPRPVGLGWLLIDVLRVILLALRQSASRLLVHAPRSSVRLAVTVALLAAGWLGLERLIHQPRQPTPIIVFRPPPQIVRPIKHHRALLPVHHAPRPAVPLPPQHPLPALRPPGAGRPDLQTPP